MADSFALHLEEYKSLRAELMAAQAERRTIDRLGAAGVIGVYAWLLAAGPGPAAFLYALAWCLPPVIALMALLLSIRITRGIRTAGVYLGLIESRYADPALCGWHATITAIRKTGASPQADEADRSHMEASVRLDRLSGLSRLFWTGAFIATTAIAAIINGLFWTGRLILEAS